MNGDGAPPIALAPPSEDLELEPLAEAPPTLEAMLEAIPLGCRIADGINLDAEDPALVEETGRRFCIAERRAGGRCTAPPAAHSLICNAHAGTLDASAGGRARAEQTRKARLTAEEQARLAALGTRGVIADTFGRRPEQVAAVVELLLEDAAAGDKNAAKALIPYLNQGLGMPTETVQVRAPSSVADLESMSDAELDAYRRARRPLRAVDDVA